MAGADGAAGAVGTPPVVAPAGWAAGRGLPAAVAPGPPGRAAPAACGGGSGGAGNWISLSPLNPVEVGPLSWAGISSTRTNLSGNSQYISNSMGTRLMPRTCCVRPVATNALTAASFFSPPSASRAAARTEVASGFGACPRAGAPAARHSMRTEEATRRMRDLSAGFLTGRTEERWRAGRKSLTPPEFPVQSHDSRRRRATSSRFSAFHAATGGHLPVRVPATSRLRRCPGTTCRPCPEEIGGREWRTVRRFDEN